MHTFVRSGAHVAYNLRVRLTRLCARPSDSWLFHLLACALALGLGVATARYTDIARRDLTVAVPPVEAHDLSPREPAVERLEPGLTGAQRLRASVRYTGKPSSSARASRLLRAP